MLNVPNFCPIFTKFGFYRNIFMQAPNIKCQGNLSSGSLADACEQTDGHEGKWILCGPCQRT
jgi:hypothetical protein